MYAEGSRLLGILFLCFALMALCEAQDISVSNKVTNPSDHTIWVSDSSNIPREATVQLDVTDLVWKDREPITVVLAIDCSGSMSGSDPQRERVDAAKRFIDLLAVDNKNDQYGIVLWDHTVLEKLGLTDNIEAAKYALDNASASGGTCIWEALNASDYLLQDASTDRKIVVLFSDGYDECENSQSFINKANEMASNGITIYTIGLGSSNIADLQAIGQYFHVNKPGGIDAIFDEIVARLKTSLENVKALYQLPNGIEAFGLPDSARIGAIGGINTIDWDIGPMYYQQTKTLTFEVRSAHKGTYLLAMPSDSIVSYEVPQVGARQEPIPSAELEVEMETNLFYDARAKGGNVPPDEFYPGYKITASKDIEWSNFGCQDIIINVTTPKIPCNRTVVFAVDASGSTLHGSYEDSMMVGIENALKAHPTVQYARVDWDVSTHANYASPNFRMASNWASEMTNPSLRLSETDGTTYAAGLNDALQKIISKKSADSKFERKITDYMVIFLTGKSEFDPSGVPGAVNTSILNRIPIHTIGLEIGSDPTTTQEESVLRDDISIPTGGSFNSIGNSRDAVNRTVYRILNQSCMNRESIPAAKNMTVVETVYPYFRVLGTQPDAKSIDKNADGTTTVIFDLGDLPGESQKSLVIHTAIDFFKLPVDVNSSKTRVDFSPAPTTSVSAVMYKSIVDDTPRSIELPEGELSIFCGEPCVPEKASETIQVAEVVNNNTTTNASQEAEQPTEPGFEALFAAIGISLAGYAYRRRGRRS